ncbi:short-chain alcohol dehydrogenase [Scheffersomyces coipomensis]|uniref:short-chain alcohol dehydrogenase n=1 Tax=Scheffersomyces coipomensis TaxID=1788519 RepID=UPI00315D7225
MSIKYEAPGLSWQGFWAICNQLFPSKPQYTEKDYPNLDGKVVIVTGASGGVGYEVTKSLLGSTNAKVYMFTRNKERTIEAIKRIEIEVATEYNKTDLNVETISIDLSDLSTIKPAVDEFLNKESRIDIIIHNAGVMEPPVGSVSKQGFELQLGTNVLGPHLLQKYLDPLLIKTSHTNKSGETRIVWVASSGQYFSPIGGVHYEDPNFTNTTNASQMQIYGQSKALNVLQAKGWNPAHPESSNIVSVSLCPGALLTELKKDATPFQAFMFRSLFHPPRLGAYTELYAALSPDVKSGDHIECFGKKTRARYDLEEPEVVTKGWNFLDETIKPYL